MVDPVSIVNVAVNAILFGMVVFSLSIRIHEEVTTQSHSSKQRLVHVLLVCFVLCRLGWALHEIFGSEPVVLNFFLNTTSICFFFTSFLVIFFHLLKKLSGWSIKKSKILLTFCLLVNGIVYTFMLSVTIFGAVSFDVAMKTPVFRVGAIVVVSYSLLCGIGFIAIGVLVWRNILLLNKRSTAGRNRIPPDKRKKAILMVAGVIGACTACFTMRLIVFAIDPSLTVSSSELPKYLVLIFGYWLAEVPPTGVMLYVMRRSYKSRSLPTTQTPNLGLSPSRSFVIAGTISKKSTLTAQYDRVTSISSVTVDTNNRESAYDPGNANQNENLSDSTGIPMTIQTRTESNAEQTGFTLSFLRGAKGPVQRIECSVSCVFPTKMKPLVALMPTVRPTIIGLPNVLATILSQRNIDRTEAFPKSSTNAEFGRTLLHDVKDLTKSFYLAVFNIPEHDEGDETPQCIGEASFSVSELMASENNTSTKEIVVYNPTGETIENNGSISIELQMTELCNNVHPKLVTKSYLFHDKSGKKLHVREELMESKFAFQVPYQLLKLLLPLRKMELMDLDGRLDNTLSPRALRGRSFGRDLFADVMVEIVEENEEHSALKWYNSMVENHRKHVTAMEEALSLYKNAAKKPYKGLTFKPSTYKEDQALRFIATNLHYQELKVLPAMESNTNFVHLEPTAVYENVTFGAPAAHTYKFKHGLRELQLKRMKVLDHLESKSSVSKDALLLTREIESLDLEIRQRHDVVLSQAVSALVTSFSRKIEHFGKNHKIMEQIASIGFLFQVESLLSTHGSEIGMLEDMYVAIRDLGMFSFRLLDATICGNTIRFVKRDDDRRSTRDDSLPFFDEKPLKIVIKLPVPSNIFHHLPEVLKNGNFVKVFPVLFTQGINEQQTLANTVGDSSLQEEINKENFEKLVAHFRKYRIYHLQKTSRTSPDVSIIFEIDKLAEELEQIGKIIQASRREKNVEILARTADFSRKIQGGRATCCKSAKDRTSMSITWEQSRILEQYHNLPADESHQAMRVMRSAGVRRENAFKNIGIDKFAFNQFQLRLMPEIYKPPKGTEGAND